MKAGEQSTAVLVVRIEVEVESHEIGFTSVLAANLDRDIQGMGVKRADRELVRRLKQMLVEYVSGLPLVAQRNPRIIAGPIVSSSQDRFGHRE